MKTLGVIGGLGPMATAYFLELLTTMTDASCDQEHLDTIIFSKPSIPDRTAYILGQSSKSPVPPMVKVGLALAKEGACHIAIPCITSYYFYEELKACIPIPILNILTETAFYLKENSIKKAGIMATSGTIQAELFQKALAISGIQSITPDSETQHLVMELIYKNVKAGITPDMEKFEYIAQRLRQNGAETIILGCTELSVIKKNYRIGTGFLDAMEVLARQSILSCGKKVRESFFDLITK